MEIDGQLNVFKHLKTNILWKYDNELGIAFYCPNCKKFICAGQKCEHCRQSLNWNKKDRFKK